MASHLPLLYDPVGALARWLALSAVAVRAPSPPPAAIAADASLSPPDWPAAIAISEIEWRAPAASLSRETDSDDTLLIEAFADEEEVAPSSEPPAISRPMPEPRDAPALQRRCSLQWNHQTLDAPLRPGSARCLGVIQAALAVDHLRTLDFGAGIEPQLKVAAAIEGLVGVAGRDPVAIVRVLLGEPSRHFSISLAAGWWQSTLHDDLGPTVRYGAAWSAPDSRPHSSRTIRLPLPLWMVDTLRLVQADELRALLPPELKPGTQAADTPKGTQPIPIGKKLRQVVSGYSTAKLRAVMPSLLVAHAHDYTAAQALCGDALGQSDASLHYYSCHAERLAQQYRDVMAPIFGEMSPLPVQPADRFGMELPSVPAEVIRALSASLYPVSARTREVIDPEASEADLERVVESIVRELSSLARYSLTMLVAGSGWRPTTMGCAITRRQLNLDECWGVGEDKPIDLTHASRCFAFAPRVAGQLETLLIELGHVEQFLMALPAASRWSRLLTAVTEALTGTGPLFLTADDAGGFRPFVESDFTAMMPADTRYNLLRHRFLVAAREVGVAGIEVEANCGHYFLGQPHTAADVETPGERSRRLGPHLDQVLEQDGWRVVPARRKAHPKASQPTFGIDCLADQAAFLERAKTRARETLLNSKALRFDRTGTVPLSEIVKEELATAFPAYRDGGAAVVDSVAAKKLARACARWMVPDENVPIVIYREIERQLIPLRDARGWQVALPEKFPRLRAELPAVTPPMLVAWQLLREAGERLSGERHPVIRLLSQLVLQHVVDTQRLRQAVEGLASAQLILVPSPREGERPDPYLVIGLKDDGADKVGGSDDRRIRRKETSLALAGRPQIDALEARRFLASKDGGDYSFSSFQTAVVRALFGYGTEMTWSTLLDLLDLARPLRQSGPPLLAGATGCALDLPARRLIQLMIDPPHGSVRDVEVDARSSASNAPRRQKPKKVPKLPRPVLSLLTRVIQQLKDYEESQTTERRRIGSPSAFDSPKKKRRKTKPKGEMEPIHDGQPHEDAAALAADEKAAESRRRARHIEWMSARVEEAVALNAPALELGLRWLLHLLACGSRSEFAASLEPAGDATDRSPLKDSSIRRYSSAVLRALVCAAGDRDPRSLPALELEAVYLDILNSNQPTAQEYVFQQLKSFHRFALKETFVDWNAISDELPDPVQEPDAGMVTEKEFEEFVGLLLRWDQQRRDQCGEGYDGHFFRRLLVGGILMRGCGLRIGEAARLRFIDILIHPIGETLLIRTTSFGSPKSAAGTRQLDLRPCLSAQERQWVMEFVEAEKARQTLAGVYAPENPVLAERDGSTPLGTTTLIDGLHRALVLATRQHDARPHWLRKSCFMAGLRPAMLPAPLLGLTTRDDGGVRSVPPQVRLMWSRAQAGHASALTTLCSYFHAHALRHAVGSTEALVWKDDTALSQNTHVSHSTARVWIWRWCDEHGIQVARKDRNRDQQRQLIAAWNVHLAAKAELRPFQPTKRSARLRIAAPYRVPAPASFGLRQALLFICDAQARDVAFLANAYRLHRARLRDILGTLVELQMAAKTWLVAPRALADLLAALQDDEYPGLKEVPVQVQCLQRVEIVRRVEAVDETILKSLAASKVLERAVGMFKSNAFIAVRREDRDLVLSLQKAGLLVAGMKPRHALAIIVAQVLATSFSDPRPTSKLKQGAERHPFGSR